MTPDLNYFRPFVLLGMDSHSLEGLIPFAVPFGVLSYWIFHVVLKRPLLSLMPHDVASRLGTLPSSRRLLPSVSPIAVVASIVVGAATHIAWDACTHVGGGVVRMFPLLQMPVVTIHDYRIGVYKVLQYLSTTVGSLLVAWWAWQWLRATPPVAPAVPVLRRSARFAILASIPLVGASAGLWSLAGSEWLDAAGFRHHAYRSGLSVLYASAVWGISVCLVWHFVTVMRRRAEPA
jgi:hypothetical protein